jgi:hypothetical protein
MASERRRSRLLLDEPAPSASPVPVRPPSPPDVPNPIAGIAAANSPPRIATGKNRAAAVSSQKPRYFRRT